MKIEGNLPPEAQPQNTFPLHALPDVAAQAARVFAERVCCAPDFIAAGMLAAASQAIGATRRILCADSWTEGVSLYLALVGFSGTRKSAAIKNGPLRVIQEQQAENRREYDRAFTEYEEALAQWEASPPRERGQKPKPPEIVRQISVDATTERLATLMQASPRGIMILRDELTGWVRSMNAYREGRGADREWFNSWWSNEYTAIDRKTQAPIDLLRPQLSIIGGLPPEMLSSLATQRNVEDGLLQRILFHWPATQHQIRYRRPSAIPQNGDATQRQAITDKWDTRLRTLFALTCDGEPKLLPLCEKAIELFADYHDQLYIWMEDVDCVPAMRGHLSKFSGYLGRLSLIIQLLQDPAATAVDWDAVDRAWQLILYYKGSAQRLYGEWQRQQSERESPEARCEAAIKRALTRHGPTRRRNLQRKQNEPATIFNRVMDAMARAGQIVVTEADLITLV